MAHQIEGITLLAWVKQIVNDVSSKGGYTVIVCPSQDMKIDVAKLVGAMVSGIGKFGGRTALFNNKGRISIVHMDDDVFITKGTPFNVAFLGWNIKDSKKVMKWQDQT